jgi:hypothetical protein
MRAEATFGPIALTAAWSAYAVADPRLVAVKDLSSYLENFNSFDGVRRGRQLAVRASKAGESNASASAVGFERIAKRRFAGAQISIDFDPECPPEAARSRCF